MSDLMLLDPVELTDAELDLVTGGAGIGQGGILNVALSDIQIDVLRKANINVLDNVDVTLRDVLSHNDVNVGAVVAALGAAGAVVQHA